MKSQLWPKFFALSVCALISMATIGNAAQMKLSDLLNGGTITSGDKLFSDFEYHATGDMPEPEVINVITIQDTDGNYGVRFQGGFIDHPNASASDALITYMVTATDSGFKIDGAKLIANLVNPDGGFGSIAETFLPDITDPNDVLYVSTDSKLVDTVSFMPPQDSLMVQKNILLDAGARAVTMSFVDQTFSQIPEPSSVLIVTISFLGVFSLRRRFAR